MTAIIAHDPLACGQPADESSLIRLLNETRTELAKAQDMIRAQSAVIHRQTLEKLEAHAEIRRLTDRLAFVELQRDRLLIMCQEVNAAQTGKGM